MSIKVHANDIIRVLINGQWFDVEPGGFEVDEIELREDGEPAVDTGTGFAFMPQGGEGYVVGPLSSITAYYVSTIDR